MSEFSRETLLNIIETDHVQCGEASALARMALAAMDSSESFELPLDYLQGHKDGLEWASQLAEANHPETGDWLYDDPIELAKAIRKGPDMPPAQPAADSEQDRNPVLAYADSYRDMAKQGVESVPIWSVITDIERNIAPLYRHAQPVPVAPEENHIGSKNALDAIVSFIKSKSNPTVKCYEEVSEQLFKDNCHGIHSHVIEYILKLGEELEDLRAEQAEMQPAPVVPDGYVTVPKEPTESMLTASYMFAHVASTRESWAAMLAAAPQLPGSEPATVPGKWVPVSEKMPPSRHEVLVGSWWGEKSRWCCKWATYIPGHPDAQSSGWLIPGASWTPTHWMPLPAAPQEVR